MRKRKCVVCGKDKPITEFGDGIYCPKTTCLDCKKKSIEYVEQKIIMPIRRVWKGAR